MAQLCVMSIIRILQSIMFEAGYRDEPLFFMITVFILVDAIGRFYY